MGLAALGVGMDGFVMRSGRTGAGRETSVSRGEGWMTDEFRRAGMLVCVGETADDRRRGGKDVRIALGGGKQGVDGVVGVSMGDCWSRCIMDRQADCSTRSCGTVAGLGSSVESLYRGFAESKRKVVKPDRGEIATLAAKGRRRGDGGLLSNWCVLRQTMLVFAEGLYTRPSNNGYGEEPSLCATGVSKTRRILASS